MPPWAVGQCPLHTHGRCYGEALRDAGRMGKEERTFLRGDDGQSASTPWGMQQPQPCHPTQPPVPGAPLGGCQVVLSLPVRGTRAASPFPRNTSQWDENSTTPWSGECGPGLPQPVSFGMLLVTSHVSHCGCGCSCPLLAPQLSCAGGGGCSPLLSLRPWPRFSTTCMGTKAPPCRPAGEETSAVGCWRGVQGRAQQWPHPGTWGGLVALLHPSSLGFPAAREQRDSPLAVMKGGRGEVCGREAAIRGPGDL